MNEIHFVYCTDNEYAPYLGVSLASILLNAGADENLNVYIVNRGISSENRAKIASLKEIRDFSLFFLKTNTELLDNIFIRDGYTVETYFTLILPEILTALDKVIYLDCDVIVRRSLAELWAYDVSSVYLGAAPDLIDYLPFSSWEHKRHFHGKDDFCYFNNGVMVLNLEKMRVENLFRQCIFWLEKNGDIAKYCDQDALNACLSGHFMRLPPQWNVQTPMYWPGGIRILKKREDTLLALSDPAIVHFTTGDKPWKKYSFCKWKDLFHQYRLHTPWQDSPLCDNLVPNVTAMVVRRLWRWAWLRLLWMGGIGISWYFRKKLRFGVIAGEFKL